MPCAPRMSGGHRDRGCAGARCRRCRGGLDHLRLRLLHDPAAPHQRSHPPAGDRSRRCYAISDSAIDPNRVDIDLTITPLPLTANALLERFYLNFGGLRPFPDQPQVLSVRQDTAATGTSNKPFDGRRATGRPWATRKGCVFNFANFVFDLSPNPTSGAQIFAGRSRSTTSFPTRLAGESRREHVRPQERRTEPPRCTRRTGPQLDVNPNNLDFPDGEFWAFASDKRGRSPVPCWLLGRGPSAAAAWKTRRRSRALPRA